MILIQKNDAESNILNKKEQWTISYFCFSLYFDSANWEGNCSTWSLSTCCGCTRSLSTCCGQDCGGRDITDYPYILRVLTVTNAPSRVLTLGNGPLCPLTLDIIKKGHPWPLSEVSAFSGYACSVKKTMTHIYDQFNYQKWLIGYINLFPSNSWSYLHLKEHVLVSRCIGFVQFLLFSHKQRNVT